jgi:hypothetical protein
MWLIAASASLSQRLDLIGRPDTACNAVDRPAGHCLQRRARNKFFSGCRHDDLHIRTALTQTPHQIGCFVGSNAARNAEDNIHECELIA